MGGKKSQDVDLLVTQGDYYRTGNINSDVAAIPNDG